MNQRSVFFVSDQTGITAETLGRSLLTQFEGVAFRQTTVPFISTVDKAREVVRRLNLTAEVEGCRPIVFATFVQPEIRAVLDESSGLILDFFDAFIGPIERELELKSTHTTGKTHGLADDETYNRRIDAVNFALANDDGLGLRNYDRADVILVGVSRSGKTPTCLFLALQYGVFAANFPLTEEHFEEGGLPVPIKPHVSKLFGLTIHADRLRQIRGERRPDSNYASARQIRYEVTAAEAMFKRHGIQFADTTDSSIEEIASNVLESSGVKRRN